jgi:hypothetical protein
MKAAEKIWYGLGWVYLAVMALALAEVAHFLFG